MSTAAEPQLPGALTEPLKADADPSALHRLLEAALSSSGGSELEALLRAIVDSVSALAARP